MSKSIAILQSNYIPWKGYFDMIAAVDEFILYDDMQYTRRDWRNRNQIKTPQGVQWLTVPVLVRGKYHQTIRDTEIDGTDWATVHWRTLEANYRRAPFFEDVSAWLQPLYTQQVHSNLSLMNRCFIEAVCRYLGITTRIRNSWDYTLCEGKSERLADLCAQAGGQRYISGPAAKSYIDEHVFTERNIEVAWFDYEGYTEYPQLWGAFTHYVSILDVLFNCGPKASNFMRHVHP
ncbi:WbqC family protein [Pseudomonas sp. NPDC089554]|uniref:WbqC family protein n=1 Tax=Pseudomonas sp. NPDC089554 TaxID=3390653 RepID=UPI003CFDC7F5